MCGRKIDLLGEISKKGVGRDALEELLILAASGWLPLKQEVVQADGGSAEGIGLNDVGAGLEIIAVNFFNRRRASQLQQFEAAFQIAAFPIGEAIASIIGLGEIEALDHGPHGAIEEDDAFLKEAFERVDIHGERGIKGILGRLQAIY